jgi:hypothetical protein
LLIEFALLDASQFVSIFPFVIHSHSANDLVNLDASIERLIKPLSQHCADVVSAYTKLTKVKKISSSYKARYLYSEQHLFLHSLHLQIIFSTCTPLFSKTYHHTIEHLAVALHNPHRLQTYEGINYTHSKQLHFSY